MLSVALFLFISSTILVFYTYVVFPSWMKFLAGNLQPNTEVWTGDSELPAVSIIIAAYNEEKVIAAKLKSVVDSNYPPSQIEILVGSDASWDNTSNLVREFAAKDSRIRLHDFRERRGKPSVINDLVGISEHEVILLTDANVMFEANTIMEMVKHFKNQKIGLVGANILNVGQLKDGISVQETTYIARENKIKYYEGVRWGTMMGPFGGCYMLRKSLFTPVPAHFLVDDFFICMHVLKKGYICMNELAAICYEDVSNDIQQEYKRKARISAGNFQNLKEFSSLLLIPFSPAGFCFISHKVLRWLTPFFLIIALISLGVLGAYHKIFLILCLLQFLLLLSPLPELLLRRTGIHLSVLRFIAYFSYMNLALLKGFFSYLKGIKSSVWTPTSRNMGN